MKATIKKPKKSSRIHDVILLAVSLVISCLVAELILRLTMTEHFVLFPRFHEAAHYGEFTIRRTKPSIHFTHTSVDGSWTYTINAEGFRDDRNYAYEKPVDTLRVLVLGDSHTLGYEVHQNATYSKTIERELAQKGIKAEVMNTGVSGFSTAEQLVFLENEGLRYDPDVVVLGFFRNDFEDNLKAGLFRLEGRELVTVKKSFVPGVRVLAKVNAIPGLPWLSQHSYLYSLALNTAWDTAKRALLDKAVADMSREYAIATQEVNDQMKELAVRLVGRMHDAARSKHIPLIILDIPAFVAPGKFVPSIRADVVDAMRARSELLIQSDTVLGPYIGLAEFHVPHGNWHINEFTHLMLGRAIADKIVELRSRTAAH